MNSEVKFEPFSIIVPIEENISPTTPGFADQIFATEKNEPSEKKITYSEEQVEEIKKASYALGYNDCEDKINNDLKLQNEILVQAINHLSSKLDILPEKIMEVDQKNIDAMVRIALNAAEKVSKDLLNDNAKILIENLVKKSISMLKNEPNIIITVNPKIENSITETIYKMRDNLKFKGNIAIESDENLHLINCFIEWQDGHIEYDNQKIWKIFEDLILTKENIENNFNDEPNNTNENNN